MIDLDRSRVLDRFGVGCDEDDESDERGKGDSEDDDLLNERGTLAVEVLWFNVRIWKTNQTKVVIEYANTWFIYTLILRS